MKYAVLGDIHGNWEALSVVLEDAKQQGVDAYACVGDIVGYNPDPARCIDALRELGCIAVQGNHDHFCSHPASESNMSPAAAAAIEWTYRQLDADRLQYLRRLSRRAVVEDFTIVHNTLAASDDWDYVFGLSDAQKSFANQTTQVCFHGHTHVPVLFKQKGRVTLTLYQTAHIAAGTKYFVNVGSVGQPRDRDPEAAYVIYDLASRRVELRRLPYDLQTTQEKIWATTLPVWLGLRLSYGV